MSIDPFRRGRHLAWMLALTACIVIALFPASAGAQGGVTIVATGPSSALPGSQITYVFTVSNGTQAAITSVSAADIIPPGTTFVSADNGGTLAGSQVNWNLGTIAAGDTRTVRLVVQAPAQAGGSVSNVTYGVFFDDGFLNYGAPTVTTQIEQAAPPAGGGPNILREAFDAGVVPVGWEVQNVVGNAGWRLDDPAKRGNNTGGSGGFAIADSDEAGQNVTMDTSLVSPQLNLTGYTRVTLAFRSDFRYNPGSGGEEKSAVDVQVGNQAWQNVWLRTAEERGPKSVEVDLTAFAGNTVRLRFRHYDANYDWWWQVDDVVVTGEIAGPAPTAPAAPDSLQAVAASNTQVNLTWADRSNNETNFEVERSTTGAGDWVRIAQPAANATSYGDSGRTCNSEFYYRVRASNNGAFSAYSAAARATTPACGAVAGTFRVEAIQVLGQQSGRFVAGKDTGVLVTLDQAVAVNDQTQQVIVKRNGTTVVTLKPQPAAAATKTLVFLCPTFQACGGWREGVYAFEATINGATVTQSNIQFQDRLPLRVLAVPVKVKIRGEVVSPPNEDWKQAGFLLKDLYPISREGFQWVIGRELDLSGQDIDTSNDAGERAVWDALAGLQPNGCRSAADGPNCYDKIIGYLGPNKPDDQGLMTNGYTYGSPANVIFYQAGMARTTAHEVGHNYQLGDEYNTGGGAFNCAVNPTPPSFQGRNWSNRNEKPFSCTNPAILPFDDGSGTATRVIIAEARPFKTTTGQLLTGDLGNFMGNFSNVSKAWISPQAWKQIFDRLAPPTAAVQAAQAAKAPRRVVLAEGFISQAGDLFLDPWYTYDSADDTPNVASLYRIDAVDGSNQVVASVSFALEYDLPDQANLLPEAPFAVEVPYPIGVTAFRIMSGTTVLGEVAVSANAPTVSITAPTGGSISGEFTVAWQAEDLDGDPLEFDVEFSPTGNEDDWIVLTSGITETTWLDDFSTLPGGSQSRLRVVATDGINTASATSQPFAVPAQAPEILIFEPFDGDTFGTSDVLFLDGDAWDVQEGWIANEDAWVWRSSLDGELGRGPFLIIDGLSVGEHVITLTVTNSAGKAASQSVTISIVEGTAGEPTLFLPSVMR